MFQFHKGSIKTLTAAGINPYFALFQFHKGSIKTYRYDSLPLAFYGFQFHKGSIKTITAPLRFVIARVSIPQRFD